MADEYLSGDVRAKLRMAQFAAETNPEFAVNVDALIKAQPRELEASEIDVRLGATWLAPEIIQKFMTETFQIPYYLRHAVKVRYSPYTAEWRVEGKTATGRGDIISSETYRFGVGRVGAGIFEDHARKFGGNAPILAGGAQQLRHIGQIHLAMFPDGHRQRMI